MLKPSYETFKQLLTSIVEDLRILSGDEVGGDLRLLREYEVGRDGGSWQDVAGTLATSMEVYASLLHRARKGETGAFLTFPSIDEIVGGE